MTSTVTVKTCGHPGGCTRSPYARGWCRAHYARVYANGDPGPVEIRPAFRAATCSVDGCDREHDGHGFCSMHLKRWRRDGDLDRGRPSGERHHRWAGDEANPKNGALMPYSTDLDCYMPLCHSCHTRFDQARTAAS